MPVPEELKPEMKRLWEQIDQRWRWNHMGSRYWSAAYHTAFGVAAVLSGIVAAISGQERLLYGIINSSTLISLLLLLSAVLTTVGAFAGFERKWRSNRRTRELLWILRMDCEASDASPDAIRSRLQSIVMQHEDSMMQLDAPARAKA